VSIVCGIDFSPASTHAAEVAARLARQHEEPLVLVHALSVASIPPMFMTETILNEMRGSAEVAMGDLSVRLGDGQKHPVSSILGIGPAEEILLAEAEKQGASLLVLGSVGQRGLKWLLGSTADHVASRAKMPVLIVRPGFPAKEWLGRERPLHVTVASELAPSSEAAVEWAAHLAEHAPCEYIVAHLSWPPEAYDKLSIDAPMHLDRTHPLVEEVIRRELRGTAARLEKAGRTETVVESNMGSTAAAITQVAEREHADLLVVGRGCEEGRGWWDRSVSRDVIRNASMSVVCVPEIADAAHLPQLRVRKIAAATDFSRLGNRAVAYALAMVPAGGEVLLVHVVEDGERTEEARQRRHEQLDRLVQTTDSKGKVVVEVVTGEDPAHLIAAAAERFGADVICVGSRGRSGLARAILGSVSQGLIVRNGRPVLIVPGE